MLSIERIYLFSGRHDVASKVARDMGIEGTAFRFIDPQHHHKCYGFDKDTITLFWCGLPPIGLVGVNKKFYNLLKSYDARIVFTV